MIVRYTPRDRRGVVQAIPLGRRNIVAKPKRVLLASSPDINGIQSCVNRYFYSDNYRVNRETLSVEHPSCPVSDLHIRLVKGRYRFERDDK